MLFDTAKVKERKYFTSSGTNIRELYSPVFDEHGRKHLACTGTLDLANSINVAAEMTDLNVLLQRFNAGDLNALNQREAFYGDATIYSGETLQSMLNNLRVVKSNYDNLSDAEKSQSGFTGFDDYLKKCLGHDLDNFNDVLRQRVKDAETETSITNEKGDN